MTAQAAQLPTCARDVCFFDAQCGMCRRTTRVLRSLDWLGRLEFQSMQDAGVALPVTWEQAMGGLPMRTRGGRVLVGFPAMRRALVQTPVGALPGVLLYVPGLDALGARCYGAIAKRRGREACSVRGVVASREGQRA